jgi:hypothetical protein
MPAGHMFHAPHFHGAGDWMSAASMPLALLVLAAFALLLCSVIPWS